MCVFENLMLPSVCVRYSRRGDAVEGVALVREVGVEVRPELDEEEGVARPLLVQLLQAPGLLGELVLYLPHVHRLQHKTGFFVLSR